MTFLKPLHAAALALALLSGAALLQAAAPTAAQAADAASSMTQAIDQRIAALKARLAITAAETPAWDAFAQAMRDNAASTNALFAQRAQTAQAMNALQNMQNYASVARSYADNTQKLADAFGVLYGQLSAGQKQTADLVFRQQATPAHK